MKSHNKQVLFGLYDDEETLLGAVGAARSRQLHIMDVYSPFPIHGMDKVLGLEESRLHIVGFIFGTIGCLFGFLGMTWIFTSDYPIIFGGKPLFALPSFVPIIFEMTVLFAAIAMTVVFFIVGGMGFGVNNPVLDDRISDDKFCLAFQTNDLAGSEVNRLKEFLKESGAVEVHEKEL